MLGLVEQACAICSTICQYVLFVLLLNSVIPHFIIHLDWECIIYLTHLQKMDINMHCKCVC